MTPNEINRAIAYFVGYREVVADTGVWIAPDGTRPEPMRIPDYYHDLNAVHEAEARLRSLNLDYAQFWMRPFNMANRIAVWNALHATAPQRCEALLRTVGKWKESPVASAESSSQRSHPPSEAGVRGEASANRHLSCFGITKS